MRDRLLTMPGVARHETPRPGYSHLAQSWGAGRRALKVRSAQRELGTFLVSKERVRAPVPELAPVRRPKVSVITPCFNYGHFLPESISSALEQDGVELELIIVDDASTDNSAAVAEQYASKYDQVNVIRRRSNAGPGPAFNEGLSVASGEFVVRLDADDLLTPGSLARAVALFDSHPSVGLVYGHPRHFTSGTPPPARTAIRGWTVWSGEDWVSYRC